MVLKDSRVRNGVNEMAYLPQHQPFKRQRQQRPNVSKFAEYAELPFAKGVPSVPAARNGKHQHMEHIEVPGRVDLAKLKVASLRKYARLHDLAAVTSSSTKEELLHAVLKHFSAQVVAENEVLYNLSVLNRKKQEQS